MRKLSMLVAGLLATGFAGAQDLVIKYNFIQDKFTYLLNGKEIKAPQAKRNYEVKVFIEDLNPFLFTARCKWQQKAADENASMSGLAGMFKGFTGIGSLTSLMTGLNMGQFEDLTTRGSYSMLDNDPSAKLALTGIINSNNKLVDVEQALNRIEYSTAKMQKLKLNPYLPADTLKRIAMELTQNSMTLKKNEVVNLSATGFIAYSASLNNALQSEIQNLSNYASSFLAIYQSYAIKNNNNFAEAGMDKSINSMLAAAQALKTKYTNDAISAKVEALEQQYENIIYTPFTYNCNYMATGDMLSLTLDMFQISSGAVTGNMVYYGDSTDMMRKVRTKTINIPIHGDMKISTSIGLGFPSYFDKNKSYSNRDSMIYGTAGNNYAPCIATYINFYPYSGRNVHWGGTFGVGIPVQNEGTSSMNFFLGGSAVLGTSSKVVIHGGLAIGQLTVLTNGQKEGDKLSDASVLPTTKKSFQPGAFFGISFALNK